MKYLILIAIIITTIILVRAFRKPLRRWFMRLRARLQIRSLRTAIQAADDDKKETSRKNMVVFNTASNQFEPIQKKVLKKLAKGKVQKKVNAGYKQPKAVKRSVITTDKVKTVEKKSLYVTN